VIAGIQSLTALIRYDSIQITVGLLTQAGVRINIKKTVSI
jgi:hypothetical protein